MTRRLVIAGLFAMFIVGARTVAGHDDYRIIGTTTKVTAKTLDVKQTNDGQTISMSIDSATIVTREGKKILAAELKTGLSVVVDARGDSLNELVVLEVRIVPPPAKK